TWTVSGPTPLTASINSFAFKDQMNGIAFNSKSGGTPVATTAVNVMRTSDGGATWSTITPLNVPSGSFYRYAIDAVDGRYFSSGQRFPTAAANNDFGYSTSTDGVNWTNLVVGGAEFFAFDLISGTTANNPTGYAGLSTTASGVGGIYKTSNVLPTRDAALQNALSVYPNPSNSGVFSVNLGANLKAGALVTVVDALGRQVKSQTLSAATVGAQRFSLDLSGQKTGVYTLQIRTDGGIATQKLVVE
ncbi:MAG: T9SS type A sorting domain-containing protein, partial [Bacteroidota bacterium]|nr:T9SS type A sorting domain-containing protein [Bacteroidota bacterium]